MSSSNHPPLSLFQRFRQRIKQSPVLAALVVSSLVILLAGGAIVVYFAAEFSQPVTMPAGVQSVEITVNSRMTVLSAIDQLYRRGLIESPMAAKLFARIYARWTGKGVQTGIYRIDQSMTQLEAIVRFFSRATTETVMVTFQEGITLKRFAEIAAEKIGTDQAEFLRLVYSDSLLKARKIDAPSAEGYLLPNTYEFFKKSPADEVVDRLLNAQEELWQANAEKEKARGLSRREILTLASIVEAETPVDAEKKRVAGVYTNRLNRNMKLEADPTVQFALDRINPQRESRRLLFKDLEIDSPYNTYKYPGLPPAPINSPGKASIEAALEPEQHKFLYFVAAADGTNTHIFSRTPDEHLRAVALYRARRAKLLKSGR
jgi:UPF0755 protein